MHTTAEILICLGLIGVVEFAALAFATHHLAAVDVPVRLRRKMDSALARHSRVAMTLFGLVTVAGLTLHA